LQPASGRFEVEPPVWRLDGYLGGFIRLVLGQSQVAQFAVFAAVAWRSVRRI
jgi:hypothetical protein